jgi:hypothetical protein
VVQLGRMECESDPNWEIEGMVHQGWPKVFRIFYTRQGLPVSRVKKSSYLARASESQESEGTGRAEPIIRCEGPLKTDFSSNVKNVTSGNSDNEYT